MKHFVKITIRTEGGNHLKKWIDQETISELSQNSQEQWPNDEGTCLFIDGATIDIISFNETIESLG